ncbi:MAG: DUF748 domain-containing protein [Steroidobacterales bacterium]
MDVSADSSPAHHVHRWLRAHVLALSIVAGLLLLYTLAGFLLVPRIARHEAIDYVQHDLGRKLSIGSLTFNPFSLATEIRDLALTEADGSPIAGFALLRIKFSATSSLLHRAWTFAEVRLEQPTVNALVNRDGSLNLAKLAPPAGPTPAAPTSAAPPAVRIGAFSVAQGRVHFEDRSRGAPFTATLSPIEFSLTDFRTQRQFENRYKFSATTAAGEQLDWSGEFSVQPLGSSGEIAITGLKAATIAAYFENALPFALSSGSLDLHGSYHVVAAADTGLSLTLPSLKVHALAIAPKGAPAAGAAANGSASADRASADKASAGAPWILLPEVDVADTTIVLPERRVGIGQVTLQAPALQIWREADGSLNLQRLLSGSAASGGTSAHGTAAGSSAATAGPAATAATAATPEPAAASGPAAPAWTITLARLTIDGASIATEDRSVKPAVQLKIAPLNLSVQNYSSTGTQPLSFDLDTALGPGGHLHGSGTVGLAPLTAAVTLELKEFDLPPLQPYVAQQTAMTIYRGRLSSQLQLAYADTPQKGQPQLKVSGGVQVTDLATRDNPTGADFITWRALQVSGLRYQRGPDALEIEEVGVLGAYGRVIIGANGSLNVSDVLRPSGAAPSGAASPPAAPSDDGAAPASKPAKAAKTAKTAKTAKAAKATPAAAAAPSSSAGPGMPIRIRRVTIRDGAADFTDHTVQPTFSVAMLGLHGSVVGLSSDPASRAQVALDGSVDRYAPVSIKGQLAPFSPASFTDLSLSFHNIELTTFNPYSGKFAGYSIAQGKLSTDLHYHVENRKLEASHHVVIDQLEFGAATDSKQAVPLPVKLAAALLKDRNGVISLDLPVSGSIDDPTFKIGPIIWKLVVGLIRKIVTAPFALLGSLFGGGEQLAYVDFPAGSAALSDDDTQKLAKLSKALIERPQLKLDVPLHTINAMDDDALAKAALEQALTAPAATGPAGGTKRAPARGGAAGATSSPRLAALVALYRQKFQSEPVYPAEITAAGGAAGATTPATQGAASSAAARPPEPKPPESQPTAAKPPAGSQDTESARIAWLEQELLPQFKPTRDQRDGLGRARAEAAQAALLANQELKPERVFLTERESGGGADGQVRMEMKLQ